MKFNWGTGIAIFFSVFVLSLVYQVYRSTQYDNSLVSDHYYADDLRYQEHYDKLANAQALAVDLKIQHQKQKKEVEIHFPNGFDQFGGEVYFFSPADKSRDFRLPVRPGADGVQYIPTEELPKGHWKIKVDWTGDGKAFYKEQGVRL
jgi:nitrogen fixation protein FixH